MRLELRNIEISKVRFGDKTEIRAGQLLIDQEELIALLLEDRRLGRVEIELAHPGESCRILQVSDVIEPRAKIGKTGEDFPGVIGKQSSAGQGQTCVLRGAAVVINDQSVLSGPAHDPVGSIIDMTGPAAEITPYAQTHNIVVLPYAAKDTTSNEYLLAQKLAGLKTARYLAQAGQSIEPDEVEIYELPPLSQITAELEQLPRVAYIFQAYCTSFPAIPGEPILYGDSLRKLIPILVHPNEILDGAIINPYQGMAIETYAIQNHPTIKGLYRKHGQELYFAGVIVTVSQYTEPERERSAAMAASMAKHILGADGVILTKSSSGAPEINVAQTAQRCEELGIKAVIITWGRKQDAGDDGNSVIFNLPKANALISTGNPLRTLKLPAVERIIGRPVTLPSGEPITSTFDKRILFISGAVGQLGNSRMVAAQY
jgi:sarcosine reductase